MPFKTSRRSAAALLLAAGLWGAFAAEAWLAGAQAPDGTAREASSSAGPTAFVCPMHPDYTLEVPGSCPALRDGPGEGHALRRAELPRGV